jgi:uncharacterized protein (TIRG00374 family)
LNWLRAYDAGLRLNRFSFLVYSIVIAVLGYGIWAGMNDGEKIAEAVSRVGISGLLFLCALSILNYFLRYLRWYFMLRHLGDKPAFGDGLVCYWAGFALTTTPGKAGETIRCLYFNTRHGINNAHSLAVFLLDRLSDLVPALLMSTAALFYFPHLHWIGWSMLLLVIAVMLAIYKPILFLSVSARLEKVSPVLLRKFFLAAPQFFEKSADLMSMKIFLPASILGLVSWSAEAYGFSWLATLLGAQADTLVLMGIFFLAMMAGVITPGGLGGTEVVMASLLMAVGLDASAAFVVSLICRVATLWLSVVIGLMSMLWLQYKPPSVLLDNEGNT